MSGHGKRPVSEVVDVDAEDVEDDARRAAKRARKEEKRRRKAAKKERKRQKRKKRRDGGSSGSDSDFDPSGDRSRPGRARSDEEDESLLPSLPKAARQATFDVDGDKDDDAAMKDFSGYKLLSDLDRRPLYVTPDLRILLETFSPYYEEAYDFVVGIAEPVSRPEQIHEYRLTPYALYAAVSVGQDRDLIIKTLRMLCKTALPPEVPRFIRQCTETYGRSKLVLKNGCYLVQTTEQAVLKAFLADPEIADAQVPEEERAARIEAAPEQRRSVVLPGSDKVASDQANMEALNKRLEENILNDVEGEEDEEEELKKKPEKPVFEFEVRPEKVENVKRRAIEIDYPLMEEYDFQNDTTNRDIDISMKPKAKIRPYQERSLEKMFGNGMARSGVIVLPCGAGKSLVGVTAACTVRKPTLCLCTSSVSVEQWRYQFRNWSTIPDEQIGRFVASSGGQSLPSYYGGVTVTTYSMISHSGKRAAESQRMLDELKKREWGLLLLDEVHVVPANVFRKVIGVIKAHCKLGLTATLLREDEKIGDINFLIGPKLYEANWIDLQREGFLATVQCAEVWCPMTKEFYREYLPASPARRMLLYGMNPNKFRTCQYLMQFHEERGDKIIIFADNIYALRMYAVRLERPFIYGPTSQAERMRVLHHFETGNTLNTILLSKVGDTSIDIPKANVLIQVSSHYGSRRQEAQRLGRILRPKERAGQNFNAFFYSLVSSDTTEMFYSSKRQQFLVDQGYAFKVITHLEGMERAKLDFDTKEEQLEMLEGVLRADEADATERLEAENDPGSFANRGPDGGLGKSMAARRRATSMAMMTGAKGVRYQETERGAEAELPKSMQVVRHNLFRKRSTGAFKGK